MMDIIVKKEYIENLKLSGNKLLIYSYIATYIQKGRNSYSLGLKHLQKALNINRSTVLDNLKLLSESRVLIKTIGPVGEADTYQLP